MSTTEKRRLAKDPTAGKTAPILRSTGPAEILMVEDSATDAELVVRAFKRAQITNPLIVISSGEEAWHYLLGTGDFATRGPGHPLLILLDLQLSGMPGLDFLSELIVDARTWDIPVVSLSMTDSVPEITRCLQRGVVDHIMKPVELADLLRVTKKLKLELGRVPPAAIRQESFLTSD